VNLSDLIDEKHLLVCCGSGGVGKTTTAAAIAVEAARRGRKVLVLTIDPARRLANSLGMEELNNVQRKVENDRFEEAGLDVSGELHALMLDPKATFDDLIKGLAPDDRTATRVLDNRVYGLITTALAGTLEYTAVEKLYDLHRQGIYDLIVLDTPPTKNALDFLNAPGVLIGFLDERVLRWFVPEEGSDGKLTYRIAQRTGQLVWNVLGRVFGGVFIDELGEFFASINGMTGAFRLRAKEIEQLLRSSSTAFIVVTSGDPGVIDDALFFHRKLSDHRMPFGGFIVNRLSPDYGPIDEKTLEKDIESLPAGIGSSDDVTNLVTKLSKGYQLLRKTSAQERVAINRLRESTGFAGFVVRVPQFASDIYDIPGLVLVNSYIFGEGSLLAAEA
jgi:anion-transporting  ArsA/GET3 family ATPase